MANELPLVSIVIPCYNQERYVRQAIESALVQSYPQVEVVVVNDGSTDGSLDAIRSFGERVVLVDQGNAGLPAARNAAIRSSKGEYIMLLDADDALMPGCVEARLKHFTDSPTDRLTPSRPIGLVTGYYREMGPDGEMLPRIPEVRKLHRGGHLRQTIRRNWGPPVGWLISRRALMTSGMFDTTLISCEDWDLLMRIATKFDIAYDPHVGALYRQAPGQMSRQPFTMYDAGAQALAKNSAYAPNKLTYWWWSQSGRFQHGRRILYNAIKERKAGVAVKLCLLRPAMLWIAPMSALSWLLGKRASSA